MHYLSWIIFNWILLKVETYTLKEGSNENFRYYQIVPITFKEKYYTTFLDPKNEHEFWLFAFNRSFHAHVTPSSNTRTKQAAVTVIYQTGEVRPYQDERAPYVYVEGWIKGENKSLVQGNIKVENGLAREFMGVIRSGTNVFVVEPSHRLFREMAPSSVVIYRDWDVLRPGCQKNTTFPCGEILFEPKEKNKYSVNSKVHGSGRRNPILDPTKPYQQHNISELRGRSCGVEVVLDELAIKHYFGRKNEMIAEIMLLFKLADQIFRVSDFDGDGEADNIGISIEQISIYTNSTGVFTKPPLYSWGSNMWRYSFLYFNECTRRTTSFCLSVCISSRDWGGILGIASLAEQMAKTEDRKVGGLLRSSGICAAPRLSSTEEMINMNALVVNLRIFYPRNMAILQVLNTLTHEIGHCFGAQHDPPTIECSPFGLEGNYLMTRFLGEFAKGPNIRLFSPCSIRMIRDILEAQGDCLQPEALERCGNAIVEPGEECDCGPVDLCDKIDPCCQPQGGDEEGPGCKLRPGAQCSYRHSLPCCSDKCLIRPAGVLCERDIKQGYKENTSLSNSSLNIMCQEKSHCDGKAAVCFPGMPLPDGVPCGLHSQHTCSQGHCNSTICHDRGLPLCECTKSEHQCELCCQVKTGECLPSSNIFDTSRTLIGLGHACGNFRGYCDEKGTCIPRNIESAPKNTPKKKPSNARKWFQRNWSYLVNVLLLLLLLLLIVGISTTRRKTTKEDQRRKHSTAFEND